MPSPAGGMSGFMPSENEKPAGSTFRLGGRAMSMTVAVVVMVVVIVIVGGAGYAALSSVSGSGTTTKSTCSPPTSPICQSKSGLTDVVLSVPFHAGFSQAIFSTQQGQSIPATVAVSGGEAVNTYQIFWGDGSNYTGANPTTNHAYDTLGWYVISAQAIVGTTVHTGPGYLYPVQITPNYQTQSSGFFPTLATTFSNGSSATTQFGWFEGTGTATVSAEYTSNSTAAGYTDHAPTLTSTGGTQSNLVSSPTKVSASYAFTTAGLYYITMVGAVTAPSGTVYQNYTWTVYVSPTGVPVGCASCAKSHGPPPTDPHPGLFTWQEVAPGGATSEDPSVTYDTLSAEPVWNIYQTLVTYNGSTTASFVPELSTCVPGPGCAAMYGGNTLIVNNGNGQPEYWTFPIDSKARFYDSGTGNSWPVYPSDMMFSMVRTCGFANLPGFGSQPGWIQCQALLPIGDPSYDGGIHFFFNNTPMNIMSSMLINDSTYCPSAVLANSNGCITFNAWGGGASWPFFLQLMSAPFGGSAEPCGWFSASAQAAGVPGWAGYAGAANGDGPCFLPGGATNTSQSSYQTWLTTTATDTYWDSFQELALNTPAIQPNVRWNMVGSGPYYLANPPFQQSVGYTLLQSPAYQQPIGCVGVPNCEPAPGASHYVKKVQVVYQQTDTIGIEQYQAGQTDFATIQPGETPQMLSLIQEGKIGAFTVPTLSVFFLPIAMEFNPTAAKTLDPNTLNIPSDFFNYVGLRQFLVNAFPYTTVENTIFTTDGIQYGFNYGGAIPQYMGNYYPTNVSWPSTDPVVSASVTGSAGWWWAQATDPTSPYYDPELVSCTTSSPCQFPIIGQKGATVVDEMLQDYMPYISSISGGRLAPNTFDVTFSQLVVYSLSALPGDSALPFYNLGWAPDYPDPTDYMAPLYYPDATYTSGDAVAEGLGLWTCTQGPTTPGSLAGLLYWANQAGIPNACQGNAYAAMEYGMSTAAGMAAGPARILMYNLVEHIANGLALYVYYDQSNTVATYASWVDPTTINTNPTIGGGADNLWYLINGNGMWA